MLPKNGKNNFNSKIKNIIEEFFLLLQFNVLNFNAYLSKIIDPDKKKKVLLCHWSIYFGSANTQIQKQTVQRLNGDWSLKINSVENFHWNDIVVTELLWRTFYRHRNIYKTSRLQHQTGTGTTEKVQLNKSTIKLYHYQMLSTVH